MSNTFRIGLARVFLFVPVLLGGVTVFSENTVHVAIHRHLHQPLYWGEPDDIRPNQSQYAGDSQRRKSAGQNWYGGPQQNPQNNLVGGENSVFEKNDRIQAYQNKIKESVGDMNSTDAGMTISLSGALQRNMWSFGRNNAYGYSTGWNANNAQAQGWRVSNNQSARADFLGMTYHHALSPLVPRSVLRKEIAMFRERNRKSWGMNPDLSDQSKGYWPVEIAFSEAIIPILKEFNYQWTMVANSHFARTVPGYEAKALAVGLLKADPPNKADILGPVVPDAQWYDNNRDTYGNAFPLPFSYQPAYVKYVDPETGQESKIIAVPACDYHGYQSGFAPVGWADIDGKITTYNDPNRPSLVLMAQDGDNNWGGGQSFWIEFAPTFMNDAPNHGGKKATTVQKYLDDHPVPTNALIHVEDGSWLAADQGSPQFYRWLETPRRISGRVENDPKTYFDVENGWQVDMRNWAVLLAGVNFCETAEQITGPGNVFPWRIEEPYQDNGAYNNPTLTEQAWHFLLWGFDSGFMYFGVGEEDEVKQTFAANRAISLARPIIGNGSLDTTPPTVFKPQRFPWNPGGKGRGQYLGNGAGVTGPGYNGLPVWSSDFWIWTLAYDVSTTTVVNLKVRQDDDGVNPLDNNANELYAGGAGVGSWVTIPMTKTTMPKTDPTSNPDINFFQLPAEIADRYWAKVNGYRGKLLDYYIEAQDSLGNLTKSEIQHVYVEDDGTPGGGGGTSSATFSADPRDCAPLATTFSATNGPLAGVSPVLMQISFSNGLNFVLYAMTNVGPNLWVYTNTVPDNAPNATVWFQNTNNTLSDNNGGANWFTSVRDCDAPSGPSTADTVPAVPNGCDPVTVRYFPNAGPLQTATQVYIHAGYNGWQGVPAVDPVMTKVSTRWEYVYTPTVGTYVIDAVFNNGSNTWDNNSLSDWHFVVSHCVASPIPSGVIITNPPANTSVSYEVSSYDLLGTAGSNVTGQLEWSNSLTGARGTFSGPSLWALPGLVLAEGTNVITVRGQVGGSVEILEAADSATNAVYNPGWNNGDNDGSGFGVWELGASGTAGQFRASAGSNPNLNIGPVAWGHYANSNSLSESFRPLSSALATGQTLSLKFDNNWIETGGSVGLALKNAAGNDLFQFLFFGGDQHYTIFDSINGRDSGVQYSDSGLILVFSLTSSNSYRLDVAANVITGQLAAAADQAIAKIRTYNYQAGNGPNYDLFINDMQISRPGSPVYSNDTVTIVRLPPAFHDGIPLNWWNRYGLSTNYPAAGNYDGDDADNGEEYVADTNPTNPASAYNDAIVQTTGAMAQTIWSGWPTTNSRVYDLWFTTNLLPGTWMPLNLNVPGSPNGDPVSLSVTNNLGRGFYRTGVKLP